MISRRGLLLGLASALVAPAIVRAESLMPVRAIVSSDDLWVKMMVIDRLTTMPVSLWIQQSDVNRVRAGLHPRYSLLDGPNLALPTRMIVIPPPGTGVQVV